MYKYARPRHTHLNLWADPVEIATKTKRELVEIIFRLLNRGQKSPRHRPSVVEIIQISRLRATK